MMTALLSLIGSDDVEIGAYQFVPDVSNVPSFVMLCIGPVNIHMTPKQARQVIYQLETAMKKAADKAPAAQ